MNFASVATIALLLAIPAAASADPGKGHGKQSGQVHGQQGHGPHDSGMTRGHTPVSNGAWVPPGLAKKPYGMPPGQAKKVWSQGEQLPSQYYTQSRYYVANPSGVNLSPAPYGSRWVKVGDNYYLAQTRSGAVSQIVSALLR